MNKDVRVVIRGLHSAGDDSDDIVVDVNGSYYNKNGRHYVKYEEIDKESGEIHNSILKLQQGNVEMIKRGSSAAHLCFEEGKLNNTYYKTVMGNLYIGVDTKYISLIENENKINSRIEYALVMGEEKAADCVVEIEISALV